MSKMRALVTNEHVAFPQRADRKRLSLDMAGFPLPGEVRNGAPESSEIQDERTARAIAASVQAGQLAVGQYATPHTRQSAEVAAQVIQVGLAECLPPISEEHVNTLRAVAVMVAQDSLGQYRVPHTRQAAEAAATEMLSYHGYIDQNQRRGEQ